MGQNWNKIKETVYEFRFFGCLAKKGHQAFFEAVPFLGMVGQRRRNKFSDVNPLIHLLFLELYGHFEHT